MFSAAFVLLFKHSVHSRVFAIRDVIITCVVVTSFPQAGGQVLPAVQLPL